MELEELASRFYPMPTSETKEQRLNVNRRKFAMIASQINCECPDSREKSLALTKLEEACMWAEKALQRDREEK